MLNFSTLMIVLLLYVEAHLFKLKKNIGKIMNLLSYDACTTIIHALIRCRLDYCNSVQCSKEKNGSIAMTSESMRILTTSPHREHITQILKKNTLA